MTSRAEKRREERGGGSGGRGSSRRLAWVLGGAAALAAAAVAWNLVSSALDQTARTLVDVEYDSPQELIDLAQGVSAGNPDAPITVMEFGDYQCPACQAFFHQAKPILDVSYVQPGRVRFVFYDFPLENVHPNAFVAARAARCAGDQDAYWSYHDALYGGQMAWSVQADPVGDLIGYATDMGLDRREFATCLRSDRHAEVVSANRLLGVQLGVQEETPTVMMDDGSGRAIRIDNWSTELRPALEQALAEAGGADPTAGSMGGAAGDEATEPVPAEEGSDADTP